MTRPAVEHVLRVALPWRPDERITECGLPAAEFAKVLTRAEAVAKFRDLGKTRAIMTTCVTCAQTADRHATWEQNPAAVMWRYTNDYGHRWSTRDDVGRRRFNDELRALAMLAEAHPEEFADLVAGLDSAVDLRAARAGRRRR